FVSAGARGTGLGEGLQKRYYLPEAHTDFIFAILGEELGIVASVGVLLLYFGLFLCGVWISMNAKDMFGRFLAFGITAMIALQAAANIAVVTGCMPTKGLPLPLISYGGTNLAVNLMMIGVLINIALENARSSSSGKVDAVRDRFHSL
ncbi:MAG: FtsW/RodA/SpoVE family cell cycle protein, partial [Kiritimatiellae bacterium]|nr:FtsW/RodA/SpoVE family cell cycle protein [Kiritimatiellia bacterium]